LCWRLNGAGLPLLRAHAAFTVLHPLYESSMINWTAGSVRTEEFRREQRNDDRFQRSPIHHVMTHRVPVLRRRLTGPTALLDFPVLEEFRELGGTDYLLLVVAFDPELESGMLSSWLANRASGFTDAEIALLQQVTHRLAIALRARIERTIAHNVANAYLGERAGQAVMSGAIRRGDGEKLRAALWYSDLRQSTTMADRLSSDAFLSILNRYFEMTAGAVRDGGGEVVSLIGDAVLGMFRIDGAPDEACRKALAAAEEARRRLAAWVPNTSDPPLAFGIALHLGDVIYGNVGVPERLQFTLVGAAVNEVVRVQDLTKELACPIIATARFAEAAGADWRALGDHSLRGFERPVPILAPLRAL
jgi:adenylate cyclase